MGERQREAESRLDKVGKIWDTIARRKRCEIKGSARHTTGLVL